MRRGSSAADNWTTESGSRCSPGYTDRKAIRGRSPWPSSNGCGLNPRRRRRWNGSPSWPIGPANPTGLPNFGAAKAEVERAAGGLPGPPLARASRCAGRPSGTSWPDGRRPPVADPRRALCISGPSRLIRTIGRPERRWRDLIGWTPSGRLEFIAHDEPWPSAVVVAHPDRLEQGAGPAGRFSFTDDAEAAGLRFVYDNAETLFHQLPEPFGGGLAILDYDGDGWLDVYCVQGGPFTAASKLESPSPNLGDRLFRNRGDGHFEDVTDASGIGRFPRGHGHGVAVGDVDGDGHPDLFVTRWRSYALYRNKGDGTFEDMTTRAGLGGDRDWPTSAAMADLDGDGDLDLYVCHYAVWDIDNPRLCRNSANTAYLNCNPLGSDALPDHLFRNDSGRFVDVTKEAGIVDRDGRGLGVVAADLDDDGKVDLFVANDSSANFLFRNIGGMRFEEVGHSAGVAGNASGAYQAGMGVAAGDLDGDGLIDLAVTNFYGESTTFYRNLGEATTPMRRPRSAWPWPAGGC